MRKQRRKIGRNQSEIGITNMWGVGKGNHHGARKTFNIGGTIEVCETGKRLKEEESVRTKQEKD